MADKMNDAQLRARLRDPEDGFVERKTTFDAGETREAVVAFANSAPENRPGLLFLGVRPNGDPVGLAGDPDELARTKLNHVCSRQCVPPVAYTTAVLREDTALVLAVIVPLSPERPHFSGHAYVRVGSRTERTSEKALDELIASRNTLAGALLRLKGPNFVSLWIRGKEIGVPIFESHLSDERDATIVDCNAHYVTLNLVSAGRTVTEPLENVTLSFDTYKNRPLIFVHPPWNK
jgi:hypothetical protein